MARDPRVNIRIEATDRASPAVQQVQGRFARFSNFLKTRFVVTLGDAARAVAAVFGAIEESATLASQTEALRRNLALQGQSFDQFLGKLREVSQEQVSTAQLIESSSKALLLGIPAEEIASLLEIARASAIATGQSVSKAFDDITTGIGRASPLILDNLGITVKLGDAYEATAAKLGKTTEQLTSQEQKQALLNAVLEEGTQRVELYGDAQSELSASLQEGRAALEDFRTSAGRVASVVGTGLAAVVTASASGFAFLGSVIADVTAAVSRLLARLPLIGQRFEGIADSATRLGSRLRVAFRDGIDLTQRLGETAVRSGRQMLGLTDGADRAADSVQRLGEQSRQSSGQVQDLAETVEELEDVTESAATEVFTFRDAQAAAARETVGLTAALQEQQRAQLRGDFARQAAERRARLSAPPGALFPNLGSFITFGANGSTIRPTAGGGTFTTPSRARATSDGRIVF